MLNNRLILVGIAVALCVGVTSVYFATRPAKIVLSKSPFVIRFSHVVDNDTTKGKSALKFKELAERYTNNYVGVDIYPNSTLLKDSEELEALRNNKVEMIAPSISKIEALGVKEFEVFDLPFVFSSHAAFRNVINGETGQLILSKINASGVKGLAFWGNGFQIMSANTPLHKPDDFKNLKMRVQNSKARISSMRALGATPIPMNFSSVKDALKDGKIDGLEGVANNYYTQKIYEYQPYMTLTNHAYLTYVVLANQLFWEKLPEQVRSQLDQAMKETSVFANSIAISENDEDMRAIAASGKTKVERLTPQEQRILIKTLLPVHADIQSRTGTDIIQRIYRDAGFMGQ